MIVTDLYQDIMLDHGKQPRNFGMLAHATCQHTGHNPLCGDQVQLYIITNKQIITDLRFTGQGCAISIASASLMTESVKGKTICDIQALFQAFHQLVTTGKTPTALDLGKLLIFNHLTAFPIRVKCATLAWHTLQAALATDNMLTIAHSTHGP